MRRYRSDPPSRTTPPRNPAPPCAGRQTAPCSRQAGTGQPPARPRGTYPSVLYTGVFSCVHPFRTLPASLSAGALQGTRPFPPPLYQYTRSMSTALRIFVQFAVPPCVRRCTAGRDGRNGRDVGGFLKEAPKPPRTFLDYGLTGGGFDSDKAGVPRQRPKNRFPASIASAASGSVPGYLHGRVCKCRKRSNAGVPGAVAPGKIILESPPSPPGKGAGGMGGKRQG